VQNYFEKPTKISLTSKKGTKSVFLSPHQSGEDLAGSASGKKTMALNKAAPKNGRVESESGRGYTREHVRITLSTKTITSPEL